MKHRAWNIPCSIIPLLVCQTITALKRAIIHAFLMLSKLLAVTDNGFCDDSIYYLW